MKTISVCPQTAARVKIPLRKHVLGSLFNYCPPASQTLRIAYNNESMPYFDIKHGTADTDTLEGAILQVSKHYRVSKKKAACLQ